MALEHAVAQRLEEATDKTRIAVVNAVLGAQIAVATPGGGSLMVPRLDSFIPTVGDTAVLALTEAGWIALGRIA